MDKSSLAEMRRLAGITTKYPEIAEAMGIEEATPVTAAVVLTLLKKHMPSDLKYEVSGDMATVWATELDDQERAETALVMVAQELSSIPKIWKDGAKMTIHFGRIPPSFGDGHY